LIKPYENEPGTRKQQVVQMFNAIAGRYDFLNHFLSFNIDVLWRKRLVRTIKKLSRESAKPLNQLNILDIATGTGDLAFEISSISPLSITGVDISEEMLKIAQKKAVSKSYKSFNFKIGDSESLEFHDNTFDFVTVAFGVRNYEDLPKGLAEMQRVTKQGGYLLILEFSQPEGFMSFLFRFYTRSILPLMAKLFAADPRAYQYLPDSIYAFPHGEKMKKLLLEAGFSKSNYKKLSGGIASLYVSGK